MSDMNMDSSRRLDSKPDENRQVEEAKREVSPSKTERHNKNVSQYDFGIGPNFGQNKSNVPKVSPRISDKAGPVSSRS